MRTQVVIIGAGPAGLALGCLLDQSGIDNVILERQSPDYILGRIRAGILEQTSVDLLELVGANARLKQEGIVHQSVHIAFDKKMRTIPLGASTGGKVVTAYGQTEVTKDLYDLRLSGQSQTIYQAVNVEPHDFGTASPYVTYEHDGQNFQIDCDIIVGCDGYHGVSRASVPEKSITTFEKIYPFGWLGVLSETPPVAHEVVYANDPRGFALCSMRSMTRSRYYIQCDSNDNIANWSDDAFWQELKLRLPHELSENLITGPSIEKSIAPLRSFVAEPMQFGRLLLAGDAAHVVPPTGAKGLNLAFSDIHYLINALRSFFFDQDHAALGNYSRQALSRVWKTERFSWYLTNLTHRFDGDPFEQRMKEAELEYITSSEAGQISLAENYVGLPL